LTLATVRALEKDRDVTTGHCHDRPDTPARKGRMQVLGAELGCVLRTLALLLRGALAMPRRNVGLPLRFADGTRSLVYRETAMRHRSDADLVLIAVRFRLRLIGSSRLGHWLFRRESLLNTFLFAAHPGFQTKLWLTDLRTGVYRGIYEWQGRQQAEEYAETLRVVLQPWVLSGSFSYRIVEGLSRNDYLEGGGHMKSARSCDGWWVPVPAVGTRI